MTADIMKCTLVKDRTVKYNGEPLDEPAAVYKIMQDLGVADSADEYLYLFCLDTHCNIVGIHEISHGTVSETMVTPREIMKRALLNNAYAIILSHNHPSGDSTPSTQDVISTRRMQDCCELMQIPLYDHVVVSSDGYSSVNEMLMAR